MHVRDAMTNVVVTAGPNHTLREVARRMTARGVGAAVVTDEHQGGPCIITERDILRSIGADEAPDEERVRDHLTADVILAAPDWPSSRQRARWSVAASGTSSWSTARMSWASSRCATSCAAGPPRARAPSSPRARGWGRTASSGLGRDRRDARSQDRATRGLRGKSEGDHSSDDESDPEPLRPGRTFAEQRYAHDDRHQRVRR